MRCRSFTSREQLNNEEELCTLEVTWGGEKNETIQSNFFIKADWNHICGENLHCSIEICAREMTLSETVVYHKEELDFMT